MQIRVILKVEGGRWTSFGLEIKAINTIRALAKGATISAETSLEAREKTRWLLSDLVHNEKSEWHSSPYIRKLLLHQIAIAPKHITFDWDTVNREYGFLHPLILRNRKHRLFNFENVSRLYRECPHFTVILDAEDDPFQADWDTFGSAIEDLRLIKRDVKVQFQWDFSDDQLMNDMWISLHVHQEQMNTLNITPSRDHNTITLNRSYIAKRVPVTSQLAVLPQINHFEQEDEQLVTERNELMDFGFNDGYEWDSDEDYTDSDEDYEEQLMISSDKDCVELFVEQSMFPFDDDYKKKQFVVISAICRAMSRELGKIISNDVVQIIFEYFKFVNRAQYNNFEKKRLLLSGWMMEFVDWWDRQNFTYMVNYFDDEQLLTYVQESEPQPQTESSVWLEFKRRKKSQHIADHSFGARFNKHCGIFAVVTSHYLVLDFAPQQVVASKPLRPRLVHYDSLENFDKSKEKPQRGLKLYD